MRLKRGRDRISRRQIGRQRLDASARLNEIRRRLCSRLLPRARSRSLFAVASARFAAAAWRRGAGASESCLPRVLLSVVSL